MLHRILFLPYTIHEAPSEAAHKNQTTDKQGIVLLMDTQSEAEFWPHAGKVIIGSSVA